MTINLHRIAPVFSDSSQNELSVGGSWPCTLFTMLHSSSASHLFTAPGERHNDKDYVPLYEGKMFHQYNHRLAGVTITDNTSRPAQPLTSQLRDRCDPAWLPAPRAFVLKDQLDRHTPDAANLHLLIGFKDITAPTNERTLLAAALPISGITDSVNLFAFSAENRRTDPLLLLAILNSFVIDYVVRQKIGGVHIKFYVIRQLPIFPPEIYAIKPAHLSSFYAEFIRTRVLELSYTAVDLAAFAVDCGHTGPPFHWNTDRRHVLRCELDATFFHLYGIDRDDVDYIMDTFPIVKRKDEEKYGHYRTKDRILQIYDEMAECMAKGEEWRSPLDPPPGDPRACWTEAEMDMWRRGEGEPLIEKYNLLDEEIGS